MAASNQSFSLRSYEKEKKVSGGGKFFRSQLLSSAPCSIGTLFGLRDIGVPTCFRKYREDDSYWPRKYLGRPKGRRRSFVECSPRDIGSSLRTRAQTYRRDSSRLGEEMARTRLPFTNRSKAGETQVLAELFPWNSLTRDSHCGRTIARLVPQVALMAARSRGEDVTNASVFTAVALANQRAEF
jgi:hypothetical protein